MMRILDPVDLEAPEAGEVDHSRDLAEVAAEHSVALTVVSRLTGPSVTTYRLKPGRGVLPRKLEPLVPAWSLRLGRDVRLTGPTDGVMLVEVPNDVRAGVQLSQVFDPDEQVGASTRALTVPFGIDTSTNPVRRLLTLLPHLLVAGATGQGKSVFVNSVIVSLVSQAGPDDLQLVLIDPKRVELAQYARLPHLRRPIVTDVAGARDALDDVVAEMERRYARMETAGLKQSEDAPLVVVIDEYADLMLTSRKQVEDQIVRIAQVGRAANVHLILATQYPKADVVTPTIKQNIPSRICFRVADHVASNVILGQSGAERLTGAGDALVLLAGRVVLTRVQAPQVSEDEVARALVAWGTVEPKADTVKPDTELVREQVAAAREQAAADAELARRIAEQHAAPPVAEPPLSAEQVIAEQLALEMTNRLPILAEQVLLAQHQIAWLARRLWIVEAHATAAGIRLPAPDQPFPMGL